MAQTSLLQVRIDTELKQAAEELFTGIGLDTSSAVRLFFTQAVARQEIPFPLTRPSEDAERPRKTRAWDKTDSLLNNPFHVGDGFSVYSREELHERSGL